MSNTFTLTPEVRNNVETYIDGASQNIDQHISSLMQIAFPSQ